MNDFAGSTHVPVAADSDRAVHSLVSVLKTIDTGKPSRSVLESGHYAAVLEVAPNLGIAFTTDGVGSKLILAEQLGKLDTIGIDCIAMNVNDVICVGAEPIALVDYLAVEQADPKALEAIAIGLKAGAELAGIEIPGGELAVLPELIRGHPSPHGFDLAASCIGTVAVGKIITGEKCCAGDVVIGLPSSGLHSNGFTLARDALFERGKLELTDTPSELGGKTIAEALLEPTAIYVRAILQLLEIRDIAVHGLAHITGGGLRNLFRLSETVGFSVDSPLPVPAIFELVQRSGAIDERRMWEEFNMGCGFCVVVPSDHADQTVELLQKHHEGTSVIGRVTEDAAEIKLRHAAAQYFARVD